MPYAVRVSSSDDRIWKIVWTWGDGKPGYPRRKTTDLTPEMLEWLNDHAGENRWGDMPLVSHAYHEFTFLDPKPALIFKLVYGL